jgi:hypothetical protein
LKLDIVIPIYNEEENLKELKRRLLDVCSGIQLIVVGILGEYLARIDDEVKQRPLYIVKKGYGISQEDPVKKFKKSPGIEP